MIHVSNNAKQNYTDGAAKVLKKLLLAVVMVVDDMSRSSSNSTP